MAVATYTERSFIGVGKFWIADYSTPTTTRRRLGNISAASLTFEEEEVPLKNYQTSGGGNANEYTRISAVAMTADVRDFLAANIAALLRGTSAPASVTPVVDEAHTATQGGLLLLASGIDPTSVVVTGSGGTPTYTVDTDYIVSGGGIEIVVGGAIADSTAILVDYTPSAGNKIETLVNSAANYEIFFDGLNDAQSGKKVTVKIHKCKLGPATDFSLISDEHATMPVDIKIEQDTSITTGGLSQYVTIHEET